jgi:single-stranded DNA-binding protein
MSAIERAFFGTLGRDGEFKTSQRGKPYLRLNVRTGDGDDADWVSVMSFDDRAIEVRDKMLKGARVYVEGKLSLNKWVGQDGFEKTGLSVMSWHTRLAQIGRNKRKNDNGTAQHNAHAPIAPQHKDIDDALPF